MFNGQFSTWNFIEDSTRLPQLEQSEKYLTISGKINEEIAKKLANFIENDKQVTHITFERISIKADTLKAIALALQANTTITYIVFSTPDYGDVRTYGMGADCALARDANMKVMQRNLLTNSTMKTGYTLAFFAGKAGYETSYDYGTQPLVTPHVANDEYTSIEERNKAIQEEIQQIQRTIIAQKETRQQIQQKIAQHPQPHQKQRQEQESAALLGNTLQSKKSSVDGHKFFSWPSYQTMTSIGYGFATIAALSGCIIPILNIAWKEHANPFWGDADEILVYGAALYAAVEAVRFISKCENIKPNLPNVFNFISVVGLILIASGAAYTLADPDIFGADSNYDALSKQTERVYTTLYGTLGLSAVGAGAAHVVNMFRSQAK